MYKIYLSVPASCSQKNLLSMEIIALFFVIIILCHLLDKLNWLKECATAQALKHKMGCIRQSDMESEIIHNFGNLYILLK